MAPPLPLVKILDAELATLGEFILLLQQEQQALIDNTLSELVAFSKAKSGKVQALELLGKERRRLFEANGIELEDAPPHTIVRATRLSPQELPEIASRWHEMLDKARLASALNQTNGTLIDTRQQQNQQLMTLLKHSSTTLSYDAYGMPRLSGTGTTLGKA